MSLKTKDIRKIKRSLSFAETMEKKENREKGSVQLSRLYGTLDV